MRKPIDAQYELNGLYYKFGQKNKLFVWKDEQWTLSSADPMEVIASEKIPTRCTPKEIKEEPKPEEKKQYNKTRKASDTTPKKPVKPLPIISEEINLNWRMCNHCMHMRNPEDFPNDITYSCMECQPI